MKWSKLLFIALILFSSCRKIEKDAVVYMNTMVDHQTNISSAITDFASTLNDGELDKAESSLAKLDLNCSIADAQIDSLGMFNGNDSTFYLHMNNYVTYIQDTAYPHFSSWISYKRIGLVDTATYNQLISNSERVQSRITEIEDAFVSVQEDFAFRYNLELVEE